MSPAATYAWNCARVGASSLPLQPPTAITAVLPDRISCAADWSPTTAADQRVEVALSRSVSSVEVVLSCPPVGADPWVGRCPPPGPPWPPPGPAEAATTAGPAVGVEPVCADATVAAVNEAVPASADNVPTSRPATAKRLSRPTDTASTRAPR